jgi:general secretion pathway protein G
MNTMNTPRSARFSARRAFTLVEIIVVIIIIGILAAVIAPRLIGRVGQAKTTAAASNAASLATNIKLLQADCGGLPTDTTIQALWECPSGLDKNAWKGPYINNADELLDPWGRPFILVIPGQKNVDFDVVSYGADGTPGGEGENADVRKP